MYLNVEVFFFVFQVYKSFNIWWQLTIIPRFLALLVSLFSTKNRGRNYFFSVRQSLRYIYLEHFIFFCIIFSTIVNWRKGILYFTLSVTYLVFIKIHRRTILFRSCQNICIDFYVAVGSSICHGDKCRQWPVWLLCSLITVCTDSDSSYNFSSRIL